jgi:hypothetical protein
VTDANHPQRSLWHRRIAYGRGLPRSLRELDRSLRLLATFRLLGWHRSLAAGPTDSRGDPIPWWTWPAICWLDEALTGDEVAFEWGSGNSTSWLERRVARLTSVEHDPRWFARVHREVGDSADLHLVEISSKDGRDAYVARVGEGSPYDLVVVDGHRSLRDECLRTASENLTPGGLLLVDDSHRPPINRGIEELRRDGFFGIPFVGQKAGDTDTASTTVLTRETAWFERGLCAGRRGGISALRHEPKKARVIFP